MLLITSVYTAIFGILMVYLSLSISMHYAKAGTTQADENVMKDEVLRRKTRAHGNFIEYVPLAIIILGLLELAGEAVTLLWSMGAAFLFARILHIVGTRNSSSPVLRGISMMTGHVFYLLGAVRLIGLNV